MALTVAELDAAIDALALGAEQYTLPNGTTVKRTSLKDVMALRELRKSEEDNAGSTIVGQMVEFGQP
jgi:hypothetical protein